jgi:hypothetical protein
MIREKAKARGVKLGNPRLLAGSSGPGAHGSRGEVREGDGAGAGPPSGIAEVRAAGVATLSGIAKALTAPRRADTERPRRPGVRRR